MFRLFRFTILAALAVGLMTLSGSQAEDKKETTKEAEKEAEVSAAVDALVMAHDLAEFGRKTKSPEAIAMAAYLIAKVPHADPIAPKDLPKDATSSTIDPKVEIEELLAEAKKMDPKSKAVAELAEKVADLLKEKSREALDGLPLQSRIPVKAKASKTDTYLFDRHSQNQNVAILFTSDKKGDITFQSALAGNNQNRLVGVQKLAAGKYRLTVKPALLQSTLRITYTNASNQDAVIKSFYTP